ncbi:MAG TPA: hypothetical protein QGH16_07425, partial [Verrucomicrobiota bacterium]|nr:hypothetical protein [Verrucomicrobiota bacterium]
MPVETHGLTGFLSWGTIGSSAATLQACNRYGNRYGSSPQKPLLIQHETHIKTADYPVCLRSGERLRSAQAM